MTEPTPGRWPVPRPATLGEPEQEVEHRATRERARFQVTLGAVRAQLEEQPSEGTVRSAARRWHDAITALTDEVVAELRKAG